MDQNIYDAVSENPIIAAVKDDDGLQKCLLQDDVKVVFILYGTITNIAGIVSRVKESNRIAMVHMDLILGLSPKEVSVDYIRNNTKADGIISTKQTLIRRGNELGMCTVLRLFLLDSMSLSNVRKQTNLVIPDFVEVLPGLMPKIIYQVKAAIKPPVIAGGLIAEKEDVMAALKAGAIAVSSTNEKVWTM